MISLETARRNGLAVIEGPHVKLAGGRGMFRAMRLSINR